MATADNPPSAESLVDGAVPHSPAISPDGRLVAYCVEAFDPDGAGSSRLWIGPSDGSASPARIGPEMECRNPHWSPDSASLMFLSGGQLHRLRIAGSSAGSPTEALTDRPAGVADCWPSADGRTVAVSAQDEAGGAYGEAADPIVWGHRPGARLRLLDLGTGELRTVEDLGDRHVVEVSQRPDGGPLAVISWAEPDIDPGVLTAELHLVDPASCAVRSLGPLGLLAGSPTWWQAHDGWHLSHLAVTPPGLVGGLAVLDVAVPRPAPRRNTAT